MNKTIIININGIVFHIEEDAYEVLRTYMSDVKRHFAYSKDSDEIVTDIENRLAEMFTERLAADQKQVVVLADVIQITGKMGNVDDFNIDDDEPFSQGGINYSSQKKLFRDPDDKVISGVSSGIAHYFGIEPRWIRLIAIITMFMGFGLPLYLILWLVIPRAVTRTDRMAMKGEPINIQSFKRNFDDEVEGIRTGFNRAHQEARPLIDNVISFLGKAVMLLIKIIGGFIILAGVMGLFALGIGLITFLGFWNTNQLSTFPFNVVNPAFRSILTLCAFIVIFIPVVSLVLFAVRVIFTRFHISKSVYFGMLILWLGALGIGVYYASKVASDFNEEAKYSVTTELKPSGVFYLKLNPDQYLTKEDSANFDIDSDNFKGKVIMNSRREEFRQPRNVSLRIVKADVGQPTLIQEFRASGPDFETALATAQRSNHRFIQSDSLLLIDGNAYLKRGELWRDQGVNLVLKVPVNTILHIEGSLNRYLPDQNLWDCKPDDSDENTISTWIMTSTGLKCKDEKVNSQKDTVAIDTTNY